MSKSKWNSDNIPNQEGKVVIITGATSGLGKEATKILSRKNATVIMAVRNTKKGEALVEEIRKTHPTAAIDVRKLELNSLKSIQEFTKGVLSSYERLDILINNAGIMACPFSKTEDGFEIQMGVNHLGHFALTGHLMPLIKSTKSSRIVATSSIAHERGDINFEDINWEGRDYVTNKAYGDSKLANLYFIYELARKFKGDPSAPMVTAAHPGWTSTDLQKNSLLFRALNPFFSQKVEKGVLPTLRAAIDENAQSGNYYGPSGFKEVKGFPVIVESNKMSHDAVKASRLWKMSEEMTGVRY